jgi:hypothetical protein
MKRLRTKKGLVTGAAFVLILAAGGAAFAYFTSGGSGTGSAKTGTASALTISQVGAGYDSLIPSNSYSQDQTYGGAGITDFGNDITLSTPSAQLVNVVVAMDNWGGAISNLPITLTITGTPGGSPLTDTQDYSFAPAINSDTPSETNITFDFSAQDAFVDQSLVFGISFETNPGDTPNGSSLNVALSSSGSNLAVGSDTNPGTVWLNTTFSTIGNDFPTCTYTNPSFTTGSFEQVTTNCGPYSPVNPGAYGTPSQVNAGSDDIPAVEFNVVGGTTPPLFPGGPSEPVDFAIINPGSSSAFVNQVTTTLGTPTSGSIGGDPTCTKSWYSLAGGSGGTGVVNVNKNVAPGTTLFVPSGVAISMPTDNVDNQDNCEGQTLPLNFSSN